MEETFQTLAKLLGEKNKWLTEDEARSWVELLWEDTEATRAKAGHKYLEPHQTEKLVRQWISTYGPHLHQLDSDHPMMQKIRRRLSH